MTFPDHPLRPNFRKVIPLFGDNNTQIRRDHRGFPDVNAATTPIYFATIDALGDPHIWPVDWAGIALQAWKRKRNR